MLSAVVSSLSETHCVLEGKYIIIRNNRTCNECLQYQLIVQIEVSNKAHVECAVLIDFSCYVLLLPLVLRITSFCQRQYCMHSFHWVYCPVTRMLCPLTTSLLSLTEIIPLNLIKWFSKRKTLIVLQSALRMRKKLCNFVVEYT